MFWYIKRLYYTISHISISEGYIVFSKSFMYLDGILKVHISGTSVNAHFIIYDLLKV